jgi:hypothetical protein
VTAVPPLDPATAVPPLDSATAVPSLDSATAVPPFDYETAVSLRAQNTGKTTAKQRADTVQKRCCS